MFKIVDPGSLVIGFLLGCFFNTLFIAVMMKLDEIAYQYAVKKAKEEDKK